MNAQPNEYLFVDGACLQSTLAHYAKTYFGSASLRANYWSLFAGFSRIFYYDALPSKKNDESDGDFDARIAAKLGFFESLRRMGRVHIFEGVTRHRKRVGQEQKQVDVLIAVHMLSHAHRGNMQRATLLTSDLDFKPLLDALIMEGINTTLWYPPYCTNKDLLNSADSRRVLGLRACHGFLSPSDQVRFPIPEGISKFDAPDPDRTCKTKWSSSRYGEVRLYQESGSFEVVFQCDVNAGHWQYHRCSSQDILKTCLSEEPGLDWFE